MSHRVAATSVWPQAVLQKILKRRQTWTVVENCIIRDMYMYEKICVYQVLLLLLISCFSWVRKNHILQSQHELCMLRGRTVPQSMFSMWIYCSCGHLRALHRHKIRHWRKNKYMMGKKIQTKYKLFCAKCLCTGGFGKCGTATTHHLLKEIFVW